jgi:hyperosmotically inducible protein
MGMAVDDTMITTKVKASLKSDSELKGADISVKTTNGDVALTGQVQNQAQADHAADLARKIDGVKNVDNRLAMNKQ